MGWKYSQNYIPQTDEAIRDISTLEAICRESSSAAVEN